VAVRVRDLPAQPARGPGPRRGFCGTDTAKGLALAIGITIQNIPEGLVVAVALMAAGYGRAYSVAVGMASGLIESVGASVVVDFPVLLPLGLGFAAGAMLFVVSHEIIPESHRQGHENFATGGLMVGFAMMMLDTAFS
jgi:zinc transporter, ZIP family